MQPLRGCLPALTEPAFSLDPFQIEAMAAVDRGVSVLVAAPTGSGKTVVAEHAVASALVDGRRAFYTTPIKALSNQKFRDLVAEHGAERVGLLTGDNAVNGDAPIVVMTTEVLRNMLYASGARLDDLAWVVLDEVHYLQDAYRGPTWEEVIINLPPAVRLVCLSATVSNVDELADWLRSVRGETEVVVATQRPVELVHLYGVADRFGDAIEVVPTIVAGRANPDADRFDRQPGASVGRGERSGLAGRQRGRQQRRWGPPGRVDVVDWLAGQDLLPAIHFIFSRAGCDDAVRACLEGGVRLVDPDDRARIDAIADHHLRGLSDADLVTLGHDRWRAGLHAGVAAHHAGMVPPFKEAVEACFVEGLVPVVFATETLALGINMPARTVVVEKLTKYTGERHEFLTPAQFTQLTGRAGRRGLDPVGRALVLWSPFVTFGEVAGLVQSRRFPLTSAFRPTYNMAANLVRRHAPEVAHDLLARSFGQFQADRGVAVLEQRIIERRRELEGLDADAHCDLGDAAEYARLRAGGNEVDRRRREVVNAEVRDALGRLRPGDVVVPSGRVAGAGTGGPAAVLSVAHRRGGSVRVRMIGLNRRIVLIGEQDLTDPPAVIDRIALPVPFAPRSTEFQRGVVDALRRVRLPDGSDRRRGRSRARRPDAGRSGGTDRRGAATRSDLLTHPVADCPDLSRHLAALGRRPRVERGLADLEEQVARRSGSLRRRFDAVLELLERWDHVRGWALTTRGEMLVRVFHECDLLIVEALAEGLFDGLTPPEVAGLASTFVYEHRSPGPAPAPWFPPGALHSRWERLEHLAGLLTGDEIASGLPATRRPDPGFIAAAHAWVGGGSLEEVLEDEDLTPGDFVRTMKVLMDVLGQLSGVAPDRDTAEAAGAAGRAALRGLVAASSLGDTTP